MNAPSPLLILLGGPNGAGKSTFFLNNLSSSKIPFINADLIAAQLDIDSYEAASVAEKESERHLAEGLSFIFETVLSDPYGAKIDFCKKAQALGFQINAHFIGISSPNLEPGPRHWSRPPRWP